MAKQRNRVIVTDLPLGTILKFKGTKGTAYRRLYKIKQNQWAQGVYYNLWGTLLNLHHTTANGYRFEEDCGMTSNGLDKVTHQVICEGGKYTELPIRVVTPTQAAEEDEVVRAI